MSVENIFQTKLQVNPQIEIESNIVVFNNTASIVHFDPSTSFYLNETAQPLGTYSIVPNDTVKIKVTSSEHYSKQVFGLLKVQNRIHSFAVVTRSDVEPIHINAFNSKLPFEMNEYEDGSKITENTFAARARNNKISTFDKNISIEYPDEQFKLDYDIGDNQFNSDTSYVTCSFYTNRVLRHSRRTKRLIASIPVSGHPCEFVEVPNIPGTDNVTNLWITLSNTNKIAIISNGNVVVSELSTEQYPSGIVYNGTSIYVANSLSNTVSKFDWNGTSWNSVSIPVGNKPFQMNLDDNGDVWVSCANDNRIFKISGISTIAINVGENPRGLVCVDSNVWVTLSKTDQLLKLDLSGNILQTIDDVGVHPYAITRPLEIGDADDPAYVRDDWYSTNSILINSEDSFFGGNNVDIQDSSGATLSISGAPQHTNFSPYQDAWSCKFNSGIVSVENNPAMYIGTSDFTIEFWINFSDINQQGIFHTSYNNLTGSMWCGYRYDGLMLAISGREGYESFGFWFTPQKGRWVHVAIARGAGATRIFIDGQLRSSTSKLNGVDIKQNGWIIGNNSDTNLPFSGYISDFHVTKTCKYIGSSDVNSDVIALDPYSVLSTLAGRNFSDKSAQNLSISPSFDVKLTHFSPYSLGFSRSYNYSGLFNGTSDNIKVIFEENLGKGDFTFETWLYRNTNSNGKLIELGNLIIRESGAIDGLFGALSGAYFGAWNHIAIVKRDGTFYRYLNGNLVDTLTNDYHVSGRNCFINREFNGYVMNFRFTYSAVYTANYIVPSKLLVIPNTKILLKFRNAGVVDVTGKNVIKTDSLPYVHSMAKFGEYGLSFTEKALIVPHQTFWSLWNIDLTIEFWINTTDSGCTVLSKSNSTFTNNSWKIRIDSGNILLDHSGLGTNWLKSTSIVSDGNWHHIAICKRGRTERLTVDGIREDFKTYCLSTFTDFPNTVHEQTSTPITIYGNMESGDILNLNQYTVFNIISGSQYASIVGNDLIINDIVPDASVTFIATTTYRGEVFTVNKTVALTHNPELVSIEIIGNNSIVEQATSQYSILANMSNGTSYVPDNSLVTWELISPYASISSTGLVSTVNIQDNSKVFTLHATYTDNGIEPVTKSTSKFIVVEYHPELVSSTISVPQNSSLVEYGNIQMIVTGNLENGVSGVPLPNSIWSVISGSSNASITPSGMLTINPETAGNSVTLRCVSEYVAGIITNTVTTDYTFTILDEFVAVDMLLSGDILETTVTSNLVSISITAPTLIREDETYRYQAIGLFDNGISKNVSAFTNWSITSGNSFATIDSTGLLIPNDIIGDKPVTIQASSTVAGINKIASLSVTIDYVPIMSSIVINNTSFNELSSGTLSITGYWDDGSSFDAGSYTTWELISGSSATINSNGDITTNEVPVGNSIIRVRATTTRGLVTLIEEKDITILNLPKLISLTLNKGSGTLSPGSNVQFTPSGVLEDSSAIDASPYTIWSIDSGVGSINSSGVLSIPLNTVGEIITIRGIATYQNGTATNTYTFTVIDDFINVELLLSGDILSTTIIPELINTTVNGNDLVTEQTTSQYTVTGHFNNGGVDLDVSSKTTWSIISGGSYASINSSGLLTAGNITESDKIITIRATTTYRGITVTSDKVVTIDIVPVFSSVTINGASSVIEQQTTNYTTTGVMDDGSTFNASPYTIWSIISGNSYASIDSNGNLTANDVTASDKTIVIRATVTYNSVTIIQDKTVNIIWEPIFESTSISGSNTVVEYNQSQLSVVGYYDGGTNFDAIPYSTWAIISGGAYGSINSSGLVTTTGGVGTIIVEATTTHLSTTKSSQFNINVLASFPYVELLLSGDILYTTIIPTLVSGTINGDSTVIEGQSKTYTLTGQFNNGGADQDLSSRTTWSIISGGAYGSINASGVFTASNITPPNKSVTIRATTTYRGTTITTDKIITVEYIQTFDSVVINGASSVNENSSSTYTATGVMDDGQTFDATPYVTWSIVSGGAYGSIDSGGILTTSNVPADQSVVIRATVTYNSITKTQDKTVTVVFVPTFDHIEIVGGSTIIMPDTVQLSVTGYMEDGQTFDATPYTTWSIISGGAYATVNSSGLVNASSAPNGTIVTVQAETTYLSTVKYDTHNITLQVSTADPYFSTVALLLNGENVTDYTLFSLTTALQINGENVLRDTYVENAGVLISGDLINPYTELSYSSVLISGELG